MPMTLTSPAFAGGTEIPSKYTGEGEDLSPPLEWDGVPPAAKSLVLLVADPDAPDPARPLRTWIHWVLLNLPASTRSLPEGVRKEDLPTGTVVGTNDWGRQEWGGPNPPIGRHRYFFRLYAVDSELSAGKGTWPPTKADVERAMAGHVLADAELMGTYEKRS